MTHLFQFTKEYFELIKNKEKSFILTKRDRPYKNGDELIVQEIDNVFGLTSDELKLKIIYIENSEGLKPSYCVIGFTIIG
jgi:hypothetical protein